MYWVMERNADNTGAGGYFRSMTKAAGPFLTREEADEKERELSAELRRIYNDPDANKWVRHKAHQTSYWVMSDDEIERGRDLGIRM